MKNIPDKPMSSVTREFMEAFELTNLVYTPADSEVVTVGLIATLAKYGLLDEAVEVIEKNTDLRFNGNTKDIATVASTPYVPYIFTKPRTIGLFLHMYPYTVTKPEYKEIPTYSMSTRSSRTSMRYINSADLGFKAFWLPKKEGIAIMCYDSDYHLQQILDRYNIPMHVRNRIYA